MLYVIYTIKKCNWKIIHQKFVPMNNLSNQTHSVMSLRRYLYSKTNRQYTTGTEPKFEKIFNIPFVDYRENI